ncbi:MAG: phosphoglucosamine mutase [Chlamydiales bacterium]
MKKLFGTDGIRGKANHYPMSVEISLSLGKAVAKVLRRHNGKHRVVIGKDTRLSCYMFENALIAGLSSMGVDTLMVGPLPTPGVAFITRAYRADAGIVISASHNPYSDNGIKIFNPDGFKLPDRMEEEIEKMIEANDFGDIPKDNEVGRNKRIADADGRYIEFVKATFPKGKNLQGLKVFLDCANGAAHRVAPLVFSELDAEVIVTGNEPDGININHQCGSLYPSVIQKGVLKHKAHLGIALDGDGDRIIMVDEKGQILDGDIILAICTQALKQRHCLKNNRVVTTVMTNIGVVNYLRAQGIEVFQSKVGDRYVIHEMLKKGAFLGGEQSGHLIFLDHNTTGDGLVSALQVLRTLIESGTTLSELTSKIEKFPQILINVPVSQKTPLHQLKSLQAMIRDIQSALGEQGRVLVRYSGTENLCRVMVEGPKKREVNTFAKAIAKEIQEKSFI